MKSYQMTIELLSDLCVSDGGVYNSVVDTDICKDQQGFPYIPGRRIKGCMRECALELADWGESIPIDDIFGGIDEHSNGGRIRISDAVLEDAVKYAHLIDNNHPIFHPQNVLGLYSYNRSQTAINRETGAAERNTLRTMRVANKGLKFVADITVSDSLFNKYENIYQILDSICANFMHIGNSRTRGLGEIAVTISECNSNDKTVQECSFEGGADILEYELYLNEPVICKSIAGGESITSDYIEGSKILGVLANRYRDEFGSEIIQLIDEGKLIFSNAYIANHGVRYTEVPAYLYSIKNNKVSYVNKLLDIDNKASVKDGENRQLNQMKHVYVNILEDGSLDRMSVETEKRYHHRRPDDKAIGRAVKEDNGNSNFYQISSIAANQTFKGYITGNSKQLKTVYELLQKKEGCRIGYGSTSEYGKVTIKSLKGYKASEKNYETDAVVVTLNAPAIVYNDKAMYATEINDLIEEIKAEIGVDECVAEQKYVKYVQIGGYNITWNKRKPFIQAFDKGTSVLLRFSKPISIKTSACSFLGERCTEGYGEYTISAYNMNDSVENMIINNQLASGDIEKIALKDNVIANSICQYIFEKYVNNRCIGKAKKFDASVRPTVSNMMLMCRENSSIDGVRAAVNKRYGDKKSENKKEKMAVALEILSIVDELEAGMVSEFEECFGVTDFECDYDLKLLILSNLLQNIKYAVRHNERRIVSTQL